MNEHRWAMLVFHALTDADAQAISAGSVTPDLSGNGTVDGPGCMVCAQSFAIASTLPCPGRVWPEEDEPTKRGVALLPRARRRELAKLERRTSRRASA